MPQTILLTNSEHYINLSTLCTQTLLILAVRAAYSPDYGAAMEGAFARIKNLLCKAAAGSKEASVEATCAVLPAITVADAQCFFERAGYRPAGPLL